MAAAPPTPSSLFYSLATNLVSGITDGNGGYDLFLRDMQAGTTTLVTAAPSGTTTIGNSGIDYYSMTPDGKYVVFSRTGNVSQVITGGSGTGYNVYRRIMDSGTTELMSPTFQATPTARPSRRTSTAPAQGR